MPADRFQEAFGESWDDVLSEKRAANAMEACSLFDCSPDELNEAWRKAEQQNLVVKLGSGFYCGLVSVGEKKPALYVFNAFFMSMRSKFIQKGSSIHCYEVEWLPSTLSWLSFRSDLVGYVSVIGRNQQECCELFYHSSNYSAIRLPYRLLQFSQTN